MSLSGLWLRLRRLMRWRTSGQEIDEELGFHLDMETRKYHATGLDLAEARRRATIALGGRERWREEVRAARGTTWIEDSVRDVRFAGRWLVRSPGFATAAIGAIALGVGATTAIYSVVEQVALSPLPYPESDELVTVWTRNSRLGKQEDVTSWPNFVDLRDAATTFDGLATVRSARHSLTGEGEPVNISGVVVSNGFFDLVGHPLAFGRVFRGHEIEGEISNTIVLSHELFTSRFGADSSVVGRHIKLDNETYEVVGVTRAGAGYPRTAEFWIPQAFPPEEPLTKYPRWRFLFSVVGRLADGVTRSVAQAEVDAVAARLEESFPEANRGLGIGLEPLQETIVGDVRARLFMLLGAVTAVLLIAVVNVANLLLARGTTRARELAARLALGASSRRLLRQVLAETVVIGGVGGLVGAAFAALGVATLVAAAPIDLPRLDEVHVDWRILGVSLVVALAATLVFGLVPAVQASRVDPATNLKNNAMGSAGPSLGGMRGAFVGGQFALALVLLIGSGLFLRSFLNLRDVDPGFEPSGLLSVSMTLSPARYPNSDARRAFYRELMDRVSALPGVESVGTISSMFLSASPGTGTPTVESRPGQFGIDMGVPTDGDVVSPSFFSTVGLEIVAGRGLEVADGPNDARVAVVNEAFARRFLAGLNPVGERFTWLFNGDNSQWFTIVGVVEDARRSGLATPVRPAVFNPLGQRPESQTDMLVRTDGEPLLLAPVVRAAVHDIDPDVPVYQVRTVEQALAEQLDQRQYVSGLLGVFALMALTLAGIGIFGVTAYVVGQRTREIGIRKALGATRSRLLADMLRQGMLVTAVGLVVGSAAALGLTRFVESQLFGLEAIDSATFGAAALVLFLVAMVACALPARRAASVNVLASLRDE